MHGFAAVVDYAVLTSPTSIVAADLNGDGEVDLAFTNFSGGDTGTPPCTAPPSVGVRLNKGDGTFAAMVTYPADPYPWQVQAADLNGDGSPDLMVVSAGGSSVTVLLNHGDGTFAPEIDYPAGTSDPTIAGAVAPVDLNGDGAPDLAVVNEDDDTVNVLLNHGDGTFAAPIAYPGSSDCIAGSNIVAADLNGDGKPDLAVLDQFDSTVNVLLNHGDGTLAAPITYPTTSMPDDGANALAAEDLNGDGKPDLVVGNLNSVSVLLNQGDGTLAPMVAYPVGPPGTYAFFTTIAAADFDGDGKPDLAVAQNAVGGTVSVLLSHGDGTLTAGGIYPVGDVPYGIAAADLNGDGKPDLAVCGPGDGVGVLLAC